MGRILTLPPLGQDWGGDVLIAIGRGLGTATRTSPPRSLRGQFQDALPMRHVISLLSTGWQDGQDGFAGSRGPCSSCHPVILSDLSLVVPVLDAGFWVVERLVRGFARTRGNCCIPESHWWVHCIRVVVGIIIVSPISRMVHTSEPIKERYRHAPESGRHSGHVYVLMADNPIPPQTTIRRFAGEVAPGRPQTTVLRL
jgi:hypothetical protein